MKPLKLEFDDVWRNLITTYGSPMLNKLEYTYEKMVQDFIRTTADQMHYNKEDGITSFNGKIRSISMNENGIIGFIDDDADFKFSFNTEKRKIEINI